MSASNMVLSGLLSRALVVVIPTSVQSAAKIYQLTSLRALDRVSRASQLNSIVTLAKLIFHSSVKENTNWFKLWLTPRHSKSNLNVGSNRKEEQPQNGTQTKVDLRAPKEFKNPNTSKSFEKMARPDWDHHPSARQTKLHGWGGQNERKRQDRNA